MSGGAFDYLCYDIDRLIVNLADMIEYAEEYDYPETAEELRELQEHLDGQRELIHDVEWVASGDYGGDELE